MLSFIAPIIEIWAFLNFLGTVSDFPEYYCAGKLAVAGKAPDAYNIIEMAKCQHQLFATTGERVVGFYMPPPALLLMAPFSLLSPFPSACIWILLQVSCLVGSIVLLRKLCPASDTYYGWLVLCLNLSGPLYEALRLGQPVGLFLLSVVISFYFLQKQSYPSSGIALAPLAMKPQLALPILLIFIALRKFRTAAWSIGTIAITYVCSLLLFSWDSFASYTQFAAKGIDGSINAISGGMATYLNPTFRGQLLRLTSTSFANSVSIAILGMSIALTYFSVKRGATAASVYDSSPGQTKAGGTELVQDAESQLPKSFWYALAIALPLGLISSLHCHDYDLLLLIPALTSASSLDAQLDSFSKRVIKPRRLAAVLLVTIYSLPVFIYFHYSWLLEQKNTLNPFFLIMLLYCSVSIWSCTKESQSTKQESR